MAEEEAARAIAAENQTSQTLQQVSAERDAKELARREAEGIADFLAEVFESPDPERNGRTMTVAEIFDQAAQRLEKDLANQPKMRAHLQSTLGKTYLALGLAQSAMPLLESVRAYHLVTAGHDDAQTLKAMGDLAGSYFESGRLDDAIQLYEDTLALSRSLLGPKHADALRFTDLIANCYFKVGRHDQAIKLREEVLALMQEVLGERNECHNDCGNSYSAADGSPASICNKNWLRPTWGLLGYRDSSPNSLKYRRTLVLL